MKFSIKNESILIAVMALPIILMAIVWNQLPPELPIHFAIDGVADSFAPKWIYLILTPAIYVVLAIVLLIDPKKENYELFIKKYFKIRLLIQCAMSYITLAIIIHTMTPTFDLIYVLLIGLANLFILLGNYLVNVKQNYFIGVKTPWTLSNEKVWVKTNRLAGRLFFFSGVIGLIALIFIDGNIANYIFFSAIMLAAIIPVVYSYFVHKKETSS